VIYKARQMSGKRQMEKVSVEFVAQECIAVRLRVVTRAVTKLYNKALRPYGLTVSQMNILVAVSRLGDAKPQDVCRVLHLDKSSLSRDVERMRARGWLESLPGQDGRTGLLRIARAGATLLQKTFPAWHQAQGQAKALLGEKDIAALDRAVKSLRATKFPERG
jgi:DNA-binding MarR family transcriptional regulator